MDRPLIWAVFLHQVVITQHFAVVRGKDHIGIPLLHRSLKQSAYLGVQKRNVAVIARI